MANHSLAENFMDGEYINMQRQATRLGAAPADQASRQTMLTGLGMQE